MNRFGVLLAKELRELATPQTLVPIVLVIVVFIVMGRVLSAETKQQTKPQPVIVVDNDHSKASQAVVALLGRENLDVTAEPGPVDFTRPISQKAVIVIPEGFGREEAAGQPATLQTYTIQSGFSTTKLSDSQLVTGLVSQLNSALAAQHVSALAPQANPSTVLAPIHNDEHIVVNGKVAAISPAKVGAYIASQIALVPIVLFIVIIFAGQMVATAMANEKENKTLETLLSVPISRVSIVGAKMLAAGIVAGLTAAAYVYGINTLQSAFTGGQAVDDATKAAVQQLGLSLSPAGYGMLGLALFLGILTALAIALVLGAFADNIKSVQSLIMPLVLLLLIPYLATMFTDLQTLPHWFRVVVYAIPFTYTFQAMPNLYAHNYVQVWLGSLYELAFFVVFMVLAAKLFASDSLLTLRPGNLFSRKR
jgi:ABC-2 type transport system permease protein